MAGKLVGMMKAKQLLNDTIDDIQSNKAVRAVSKALIIGGSQAALYTPIDTSTLINSQYRDVRVGANRITGRVGYSARYATYVHDPAVKQQFRRTTAKKLFLRLGFDESASEIDAAIRGEMKL